MFHHKDVGLPMAGSSHGQDGSVKAIHVDPPIWRAWKNADGYIKGSYMFLLVSILMIILGIRQLRYHNASIWLTCHAEECTLELTPPGRGGYVYVDFHRRQLLASQAIKVNPEGKFVKIDHSSNQYQDRATYGKNKNKKKVAYAASSAGPDKEGNYDSYHLVLRPGRPPADDDDTSSSSSDDAVQESDFAKISQYTTTNAQSRVLMDMRKFNRGQTRRRTRTMINKIESYIKKRRHKLVVKENSNLSVVGILSLVIGLFMLLLTVLVGQFMEEKPRRQGGPGARRQQAAARQQAAQRRAGPPPTKSNLKYRASAAGVRSTVPAHRKKF